jgi:hypothetical protein
LLGVLDSVGIENLLADLVFHREIDKPASPAAEGGGRPVLVTPW